MTPASAHVPPNGFRLAGANEKGCHLPSLTEIWKFAAAACAKMLEI
jgi:hypothetical protein